ncbi:hypothetical protein D3C73_1617670 [compost metagenome]
MASKVDQADEQQQVDCQRQQHEQAQARAQDQFQSFAQVLRAREDRGLHRGLRVKANALTLPSLSA